MKHSKLTFTNDNFKTAWETVQVLDKIDIPYELCIKGKCEVHFEIDLDSITETQLNRFKIYLMCNECLSIIFS